MRKSTALFTLGLTLVAGLGVSSAQTSQAPASPAPTKAERAADRPEGARVGSKNALGKVKAATADTLVVAGKSKGQDIEWTFALDGNTKIKKEGRDASAAELKAGDGVQVRYRTEDGKNIAAMVLARTELPPDAKAPDAKASDKVPAKKP